MGPAACDLTGRFEPLEADLTDDRAKLRAAFEQGRTGELLDRLATMGRRVLDAGRAARISPLTAVAAYLMLHGVVVHNARRADLAAPLAERWRALLAPPPQAAIYLDDAVTRTFATCQLERSAVVLPDAFAEADSLWLSRAADILNRALTGLPTELWQAVATN